VQFDVSVSNEETNEPLRMLLYGGQGIGKTTFAAGAPAPVIIKTEDGTGCLIDPYTGQRLQPARIPSKGTITSYAHYCAALEHLVRNQNPFQTIITDSADWLERLIHDEILAEYRGQAMAKVAGGYGAGYEIALKKWTHALNLIKALWHQGKAIIFIAHADPVKFESPDSAAYDRWVPRLHKKSCALLTEWVDVVGFATQKVYLRTIEGEERKIAHSGIQDERVLKCTVHATALAKTRFPMPPEIPLSWSFFARYLPRSA
jgi:hypothetical protein